MSTGSNPGYSLSQSYMHSGSLEPMALGSPPSMGPGHQGGGTHSNLFLPGYLMGDMGPALSVSITYMKCATCVLT